VDFTEVNIEITPFSDDFAEIVIAAIEELPFESFVIEAPILKAYIPKGKYDFFNWKRPSPVSMNSLFLKLR